MHPTYAGVAAPDGRPEEWKVTNCALQVLSVHPELPYMDVGYGELARSIDRPVEGLCCTWMHVRSEDQDRFDKLNANGSSSLSGAY
jgi:hypothetical protein